MLKKKYIQNFLLVLTFLAFACISDICIIHTQILFDANDMLFHLKRVYEIYNWNYLSSFAINYFHGSAVMGMYPFLSVLPLAFMLHIMSSYIYAYYYFFILIVFSSLLVSFFSSLRFSKSKSISYLFAILYSLSISFLITYFKDGDLGIVVSLIFLPLVIFGILDILNNSKNYIKLSLGVVLMTFCQLPSTIITILFILILILININRLNRSIFYNLLKSMILIILLTSIIWIPFLKIILFNKIVTPTSSQIRSSNIVSIVKNVGIIPILSIFALPVYFKKFNKYVKQMCLLSIIIIIISSSYVPLIKFVASMKFLNVINTFQFTARFLIIPQVILCYLASWIIVKWLSNLNKFDIYFVCIVTLIILSQIAGQSFVIHYEFSQPYRYANSYRSVKMGGHYMIKSSWIKFLRNGYLSNTDYYPKDSIIKQGYINNNEATYNNNTIIHVKHIGYNKFSFNSPKQINQLTLPLLHYNNEHLRVYVNNHLTHYHTNSNNLITLSSVKKGKHQIKIKYIPNVWLVILKTMMFFGGILWLLLICYKNHKKKLKVL